MQNETEDIIERNERFWLEMTKLGTLTYCHELLKLSTEFQNKRPSKVEYYEYLGSLDEHILKYIDVLNAYSKNGKWGEITPKDSPFPSDIHGYIHEYNEGGGWFQPKHLMCKLAVLRDATNKINYEFLIEYDILSPDVEIYFGVKAVSDSWESTEDFKKVVIEQWEKVRQDKYKRYAHRFKLTTNVNHGTFWPFWWRMNIDCKEELIDTILRLKVFYQDYKKVLDLHDLFIAKFDKIQHWATSSLLTNDDYNYLLKKITDDYNEGISKRFEIFLQKCVEKNVLVLDPNNNTKYHCAGTIVQMMCLIKVFFFYFSRVYENAKFWGNDTPKQYLVKVVMDKHGRIIRDSYWRKEPDQMHPHWENAVKMIQEMFPELLNVEKLLKV